MNVPTLNRANNILLLLVLLTVILYYGRQILVILTFAMLLAMLMTPVSNKMERKGIDRVPSTILSLLMVIIVFSVVSIVIGMQISYFIDYSEAIQQKASSLFEWIRSIIEDRLGISNKEQMSILEIQSDNFISSAGRYIKSFLMGLSGTLGSLSVIFVFMFLFLLHREKYETFILKLYKTNNPEESKRILAKISRVSQQYLLGRFISIIFLMILYFIGFAIIGLKNAFLLSAIAAFLTIIPYVGPVLGGVFPFTMALVTEDSFTPALLVAGVIFMAQLFDNYFIEPYVVGGEVSVSPFFTLLILLIGGFLWGVAGVIAFLPLLGMVKIICDNVEELKPYGYLIGDKKDSKKMSDHWKKLLNKFR